MADQTLEERVAKLETEVARLIAEMPQENASSEMAPTPRWKKIIGVFKDNPEFEEAVRFGREYRASQVLDYGEDET